MISFQKHDLSVISDLELVNSADHEETLHFCESKKLNLNIEDGHFFLNQSEDKTFEDIVRTSSFLE